MKKLTALILALTLALSLAACSGSGPAGGASPSGGAESGSGASGASGTEKAPLMSRAEFDAAELGNAVTVETYIQAKQVLRDGKANFYTQSEEGAYFIFQMPCTQEEYDALAVGTGIRVSGTKSEWSGETEITDAAFEIIEGAFIADPADLTAIIGAEELAAHRNELVRFRGLTVEPSAEADGGEFAFIYGWDGAGGEGDDLYFNASSGGVTVTFTVESDLCGVDSGAYRSVKGLKIGDAVDITCFLYWYDGAPNPHVVAVSKAG